MQEESTEEKIRKIQKLFKGTEAEVRICSYTESDEKYCFCEAVCFDEDDIPHYIEFYSDDKTERIDNISAADITETGKNIDEALNNLYRFCKMYVDHHYTWKIN